MLFRSLKSTCSRANAPWQKTTRHSASSTSTASLPLPAAYRRSKSHSKSTRGIPQIEVTFEIDANGILNVSAKDKATGKEQSIRIEASSGLTDAEIKRMKDEAAANAAADAKEKERIDKLNHADAMIFQTEKQLAELGDKILDDLDDDETCRNEKRVKDLTDWVKEALFGALDVGRGRFIMVGNLISKTSVLANICASKGVHVSEIKAVDAEGNPVWADKWTREEAEAYRDFVGYRAWEKEMMHNPIKDGTIFRHEWIRFKKILPLHKYDMLVCYTDPSFKSTTSNDYKASRLWGKVGTELHLIDCYVRQDTVSGMVRWLYNLYESLPDDVVVSFFMEANFMQDIILDEFDAEGRLRGYQLPLMPDTRKKPEKIQRIEAVSPLWERGKVFYNEELKESPDMQVGIDQTLSLERGSRAHDDAPDADEGAIWILQRCSRQEVFKPVVVERRSPKNMW